MTDLVYGYIYRMIWALILGFILAFSFRRSWKAEHGKLNSCLTEKKENTMVGIDPLVLPFMLVSLSILYFFMYGFSEGKEYILSVGMEIFMFISIYFTLLIFLLPVLRKYYTARTCATFWLIPVFLFYQPNMLYDITITPKAVFYIPEVIMKALLYIWMTGFIVIFSSQIISHIRFTWKLKKYSYLVEDGEITEKWNSLKKGMDLYLPIELRYCRIIHTPLTVGMREKHRITYLPEQAYSIEDIEMIFSHELHHIQRNDTHTKFFLRFCKALGWFHPFIWIAIKKAEDDLELSCDEIVLKDAGPERRKKYAELLLTTAACSYGFTTCLSASASTLKYRMRAIIHEKKKKLGTILLFTVMVISVFCTGKICFSTERKNVGEILQFHAKSISKASFISNDNPDQFTDIEDIDKLIEYLSELQAERVLFKYDRIVTSEEQILLGIAPDVAYFYIFGNYMEVNILGNKPKLFHLTETVDWDYISFLVSEN